MNDHNEWSKLIDLAAWGTLLGTFAGFMPAIAALFTIIWTAIRIYETETVQGWLGRRKGGE